MSSGQPRPETRIVSRCTAKKSQGTHAFEIIDYSLHRGLRKGKFISSVAFDVGGYSWCIRFYPDGDYSEMSNGSISVFLKLLTKEVEVRALYDLWLLDQNTGLSCSIFRPIEAPSVFSTMENNKGGWGRSGFFKRSELESSTYLQGDRLVIECDVTVIKETCVLVKEDQKVQVAPSNLSRNFGKLLETEEGSDVSFNVGGVVFRAHKIVLAVGSPVFKAELYGPLGKDNRQVITIQDIQPAIFKGLLYFIYTDTMPSMEDSDGDETIDFIKHLLVAADRYGMAIYHDLISLRAS
ncbi:hypothetical protein QOZ80_8BG0651000 [Eleusine coracana subsp. coracana]|nr:hypothetical protein QOZ80_8BG0651000 [Eleusine coracana subsp. coracana]